MNDNALPNSSTIGSLLAKSAPRGRAARTLVKHTDDVITAFEGLFGRDKLPTSLTTAWLRFFKLEEHANAVHKFLVHGRLTAFCHDWGKANDGFQQMLAHRGAQSIRHEHLSAVLIAHEPIWRWLESGGYDVSLVLAAVVGHHLKARDINFGALEPKAPPLFRVRWDNGEFRRHLAMRSAEFGLPDNVPIEVPRLWATDGTPGAADLNAALDAARDRLNDLDRALAANPSLLPMLWAIRAALVAADSAGSGLVREDQDIIAWIRDAFFVPRLNDDMADGRMTGRTVASAIVKPRMQKSGITDDKLNSFQRACDDVNQVPARALLLAPCGSGKTLAAWRWVSARCAEQPRRRAIFLYPTRGTATEGCRDYVALAGPEEAALVHGTADLDLNGIHPDLKDEDRINEARLFALRQWPKRLFSATVDQFLGFMQHAYGPTCHLPLLVDSVVVCDEIHSYDRGMFSALIQFLRYFNVPVLCMTATMLDGRRERLLKGGELGPSGLTYVNGLNAGGRTDGESELQKAATHKRYAIRRVADESEAAAAVRAAIVKKLKVLWVLNTVDRCQRIARDFAKNLEVDTLTTTEGAPLFCYHSRFRLKDRQKWHKAVVDAFKSTARRGMDCGALAVTTQVCEMSLDLDADVLVTEICPGTALVQRVGRCCRDPDAHKSGRTGEVIVYTPPGDNARARESPYTAQEMDGVGEFIESLGRASPVSQAWLEAGLQTLPSPPELPKSCRFIESGPWAAVGEEQFRDSDDLTRPAVLSGTVEGENEADADAFARIWNPKTRGHTPPWKADELVINVPKSKNGMPHVQPHGRYDLPQWLNLAILGTYFKTIGFCCGMTPNTLIV